MKTILIVDSDLGFVFWLGRLLEQAGYDPLPAKSVPDGISLRHELNVVIDMLIVNSRLPGAAELVGILRILEPQLKVVAVIEDTEEEAIPMGGVDVTKSRDFAAGPDAAQNWLRTVTGVFSGSAKSISV